MNTILSSWDFSLKNFDSVWRALVVIGILLIALMVGNILRNVVPFFRKALIPSALLGGLIVFIIKVIINQFVEIDESVNQLLQVITYHGLGIGFIAMSLKTIKSKTKVSKMKSVENGAMTGGAYMLQAVLGLAITIVFFLLTKGTSNEIYYTSGIILPLGFGQGPGNALTWDVNFTNLSTETGAFDFTANGSFGLSIASIGFIVASVFGIFYINLQRRRGTINIGEEEKIEKNVEMFESENEIPDNESIDKMSIQVSLIAICYALSFGIMCMFAAISDFTGGIAWGFNFIWGVITANLVKLVMNGLKKKNVIKREYINNYQMDRISGFAFDLMIVAGVAAIEIKDVIRYLWPLIVLCAVGAFATYAYIRIVTKHCFKGYENEMFVTNFGTVTGTASNGMILLKEIDPNYKSPASNLFVVSQLPAMLFVAPLLLLLNFAAKSFTNTIIALAIFLVLFIAYNVFLFRDLFMKKKDTKNQDTTK